MFNRLKFFCRKITENTVNEQPVALSVSEAAHGIRIEFEACYKDYAFDMHGNLISLGTVEKESAQ